MSDITYLTVKKFLNDYRLSGVLRASTLKDLKEEDVISLVDSGLLNNYELIMLSKYFPVLEELVSRKIEEETSEENILVFKRQADTELPVTLNAIKFANPQDYIEVILNSCSFKQRQEVEYDRNYVQIIPNIIVEFQDTIVLLQKNNKKSRNYNTIGLPAGHVSAPVQANTLLYENTLANLKAFKSTVYSELREELGLEYDGIASLKIIEVIPPVVDPLNVSFYHLGITVLVTLHEGAEIWNAEPHKHHLMYYRDLKHNPDHKIKLENWCIESLLHYNKYKEGLND